MFNKVFEYAGSHKKSIYLASFIMLISNKLWKEMGL